MKEYAFGVDIERTAIRLELFRIYELHVVILGNFAVELCI